MSEQIKACWFCEYFYYVNASAGYSEYTPGSSFEIGCNKSKWEFDPYEDSQETFGKILQTAESCPDYKP